MGRKTLGHCLAELAGQVDFLRLRYVGTTEGAAVAPRGTGRACHDVRAGQEGGVDLTVHTDFAGHGVHQPGQSFVGFLKQEKQFC